MKERTQSILEAAVRDFIRTGHPITSERLFDTYEFGIKPAMIRWELNELAEAGFFFQTHPSGGRLPTNKAYRFFVSKLLASDADTDGGNPRTFVRDFLRGELKPFIEEMAEYLNVLGVGYATRAAEVYESGLKSLLDSLETDAKRELLDVVQDFESLPERLSCSHEWCADDGCWPKVFIGTSPVTRSEHLSVVAGRLTTDDGEFVLMAIGPKRMDYKKSVSTFRRIKRSVEAEKEKRT
jgi:transcriptional regulator of heat shock response